MRPFPTLLWSATCATLTAAATPHPAATQTPPAQAPALPAEARRHASPYLPLGHWAYDYLHVLVARGRLDGLSPLVQPYRRADVAAALGKAIAQARLDDVERAWAADILRELAYEASLLDGDVEQEFRLRPELRAGLDAMTHEHRDPLRPQGDDAAFVTLEGTLHGSAPNVAGAFRARWDNHYLNDPQFAQGRAIEFRECDPLIDVCAYRVEDAYVELQFPYVRVFFGRTHRNWGLPGTHGMLLSDYAYSYDHVGYRFAGSRLSVNGLFTLPNDFTGDTARYFSTHRLDWRVRDNLVFSAGESVVYGGPDRRLDLALTNPIGIWEISGSRSSRERNALGLVEVWWRPYASLVTYAAFLVDNTSVGTSSESEIPQWGATLGVQMPRVTPRLALRLDLSAVNSLAYRSRVGPVENYAIDGIGLARDKTDALTLRLRADWFARPGLVWKPTLDVMWKGEDDLPDPWPADAFTGHDLWLAGTVETTVRPALAGRWRMPYGEVAWDLGVSFVHDRGHVERGWTTLGTGRIRFEARRSF